MRRCVIFTLFLSVLFLGQSCIKESRDGCPCYLYFAHSGFDPNGYDKAMRLCVFENDNEVFRKEYMMEQLITDNAEVGIPKGMAEICGMGGVSQMMLKDKYSLLVPFGKDADPLYAFSDKVLAEGERAKVFGRIHKHHCHVTVDLKSDESMKGTYAVRVIGNSKGMDIRDFSPIEGEFSYVPSNADNGKFQFNLPRQVDKALALEIYGSESPVPVDGNIPSSYEYYNTFDIGKYLVDEMGYDWQAESLNDVYITIDYARCEIILRVNDWTLVKLFAIYL